MVPEGRVAALLLGVGNLALPLPLPVPVPFPLRMGCPAPPPGPPSEPIARLHCKCYARGGARNPEPNTPCGSAMADQIVV